MRASTDSEWGYFSCFFSIKETYVLLLLYSIDTFFEFGQSDAFTL